MHVVPPSAASVSVTEPGEHSMQWSWPSPPWYSPTSHIVQLVAPDESEYWPGSQLAHATSELELYNPGSQAVHVVAPGEASVSVVDPAGHVAHVLELLE